MGKARRKKGGERRRYIEKRQEERKERIGLRKSNHILVEITKKKISTAYMALSLLRSKGSLKKAHFALEIFDWYLVLSGDETPPIPQAESSSFPLLPKAIGEEEEEEEEEDAVPEIPKRNRWHL